MGERVHVRGILPSRHLVVDEPPQTPPTPPRSPSPRPAASSSLHGAGVRRQARAQCSGVPCVAVRWSLSRTPRLPRVPSLEEGRPFWLVGSIDMQADKSWTDLTQFTLKCHDWRRRQAKRNMGYEAIQPLLHLLFRNDRSQFRVWLSDKAPTGGTVTRHHAGQTTTTMQDATPPRLSLDTTPPPAASLSSVCSWTGGRQNIDRLAALGHGGQSLVVVTVKYSDTGKTNSFQYVYLRRL